MENLLRRKDLVENPTSRVPVCLCLDVSGSMDGDPIDELNRGIKQFYYAIKNDEIASYSAEISIVTFGGTGAVCMADFANLQLQPEPPVLTASGITPMGEAVNMALNLLETRKQEYKEAGVDYYQPWLVLMTDGEPNGSIEELNSAILHTSQLANEGKLTVFPIGIGNAANMEMLAKFSPKRTPLRLKGLKFQEFFQWLSQSVAKTSQSMPGEKITLGVDEIGTWGEL